MVEEEVLLPKKKEMKLLSQRKRLFGNLKNIYQLIAMLTTSKRSISVGSRGTCLPTPTPGFDSELEKQSK